MKNCISPKILLSTNFRGEINQTKRNYKSDIIIIVRLLYHITVASFMLSLLKPDQYFCLFL